MKPITLICRLFVLILIGAQSTALAQRDLKNIPDPDPELERQTFIVADGFEVNLYAADPLLAKPIQMNFDAQGRLWVASSEVYPQVKPGQEATDKILVLEDRDGDGKAEQTTVFADGLLIPTGVIPDMKGGAYVVNSTELLHFTDADGDLKADARRIVLSGFGTEDTHHLLHTLRWGPDGCLYMNQSIYIHSHVETPYGVKRLGGGGIWRFRPETLEMEVLCRGFVNPWGHKIDDWGQSFATDGAFGEGINYVFPGAVFCTAPGATRIVKGLNPGSPKHCSLEIVGGSHLPDDWQGNMITNDFRAHRVCRFVVTPDGSGYASRQETELIKTQHVAFRPIDVAMGPDGAIYIADWYNPIIQHGEVDFRDERRDHTHGRIWRVTAKNRPLLKTAIDKDAKLSALLELLKSPDEWVRLNAKLMLKNRPETAADKAAAIEAWLASLDKNNPNYIHQRLEGLWCFENINRPAPELLQALLASPDHRARAAAVRVAMHWRDKLPDAFAAAARAVSDEHPQVRLEAVCGLANFPRVEAAQLAATALDRPMDPFLDFALWTTLRELAPVWLPALKAGKLDFGGNIEHLTFALKAVDSPDAVAPLLALVEQGKIPADRVPSVLQLAAALGGPQELSNILDRIVATGSSLDPAVRAALLNTLVETARLRKVQPAGDLARIGALLQSPDDSLRAAAIRAVGAWKLATLREAVTKLATAAGDSSEIVRFAAIDTLPALGGPPSKAALSELAGSSQPPAVRQRAIAALSSMDLSQAARLTAELLAAAPADFDPTIAVGALLAKQQGAKVLTAAIASQQLAPDVAKRVLSVARSAAQPSAELIAGIQKAGGLGEAVWKLTPELTAQLVGEVQTSGNPARGEAIYRTASMQCLKCHSIGGAGGLVGPDLVSIGATAQLDYLIESLLAPAAKVKENYHSKLVLDDAGRVYTGIPIRDTKEQIVLRDAEDKLVTLAKDSIEQMKDGRSLMPDGLVDTLTRQDLVDLISFLSQLGKVGGKYSLGQSRFVRRWQVLPWTKEANSRLNRTSYDSAAGNEPVFAWTSVYSRVAGDLPLAGLPEYTVHRGNDPVTFLRAELDVTTPGPAVLVTPDITGLTLWIDGKPAPIAARLPLDLTAGRHTLTLAVNRQQRAAPLAVGLEDAAGSPAQLQIVGGK